MEEFVKLLDGNYSEENIKVVKGLISKLSFEDEQRQKLLSKGLDIAKILLPLKLDTDTICASILLGFLRENVIKDEDFEGHINSLALAKSVLRIQKIDYTNQQNEIENIRAMLVAIAKDIRVIIIRLCEILYLARHTKELEKEFAAKLHYEIRELYSPIASRLGLTFIKSELNDLNLSYFKPSEYRHLLKEVAEDSRKGNVRIEKLREEVKKMLEELSIKGEAYGRVKHISSIHAKLQDKSKTLSQIYDLCALRILVQTTNDCYAVLGLIHTKYVPISGRFKDYIARPKSNGYQSLHTVILVDDEPLEVQIRTYDMHNHAEYGIAAHWLYKEHKNKTNTLDEKLMWIRKLIENKDNYSAGELIEELKTDVYSGEIFVQTPKGKIIQLTENSTPIDFAYAIHSEVGNKCVGAKVNDKIVPLISILNNGDVVEIMTNQKAKGPSRDWLKFVKTQQAKSRINAFFRQEMKEENIKKGKTIIEQAAKNHGYPLHILMSEQWVFQLLEKYAFHTLDEMYAAVGYGSLTSTQVINKLIALYQENTVKEIKEIKQAVTTSEQTKADIEGLVGIMIKFAKCCSPIPGDDITGFVSRGSGVTIHRSDCVLLKVLEKDRLMPISWGSMNSEQTYSVSLKLYVKNSTGVLAAVSAKIAENKINLTGISSEMARGDQAVINISFNIKSKKQLDEFINKLSAMPEILEIVRGGK